MARVVIALPEGERELKASELPVLMGSGAGAHIRLPGPATAAPVASINLLDGRTLVQCYAGISGLQLNGEPFSGAQWLQEGDRLSIAGVEVQVEALNADGLRLAARYLASAWDTRPPELTEDDQGVDIPLQPASGVSSDKRGNVSRLALRAALGTALGILGLCALFVFTAEGVLIEVEPAQAEVRVEAFRPTPHVGSRYLLWSGTYRVRAEMPRYYPLDERIEVGGADGEEFRFAMELLPGRVVVETIDGARIAVEGMDGVFQPGDEIELAPGSYVLKVSAPRYKELTTGLTVRGGGDIEPFVAALEPDWAEISVRSTPSEAEIRSEGELLGLTPVTVELLSGQSVLLISKPGFATHREELTVVAGANQTLPEIRLRPAAGVLRVSTEPPGAAITVDGEFRGGSPATVEVSPDRQHRIVLSRAGYEPQEQSLTLGRGEERRLNVRLAPRLGTVRLLSRPAGATVFVDGVQRGQTPLELELPSTEHRIDLQLEGYVAVTREVIPQPAYPQEIAVEMLTPLQARLAAQPREIETSLGAKLVMLFPGEFEMGSQRGSQGWRNNEVRRRIRLDRRYYLGVTEVSNREFRAFVPTHTSGAERFRSLAADSSPAVNIDWQAAAAFCNWLSSQENLPLQYVSRAGRLLPVEELGVGYRLPTEAEWVWAARYSGGAGDSRYPWGERMPPAPGSGNFADQSASGILTTTVTIYNDNFPFTAPAGSFAANRIGFFDLGGNAAEWTNDFYGAETQFPNVEVNPRGAKEGRFHVIRGSSWMHGTLRELRWSFRDFGDEERLDVGFRLARYVEPQEQE
ncbi:PEGA domain-containing protein [Candidatus Foliamicus sp.]